MPYDDSGKFSSDRTAQLFDRAIDRRRHDLDRAFALIDESRRDFLNRLDLSIAGIAEAGEARAMLEERLKRMLARTEALRDGKADRRGVSLAQAKDMAELDNPKFREMIARVIEAAGGVPRPPREAMALMTGHPAPEAWLERTGNFGTLGFLSPGATGEEGEDDDDVGTARQGLDDDPVPMVPPPLSQCSQAPYADDLSAISQQAISACFANIDRSGGTVRTYSNAGVGALVPGFSSARGVVLADVTLPPGYTSVTVTAGLAIDVRLSAWAALAATWSVADLLVTAEHSDGSFSERSHWVSSQVAPGIWGGSQRIVGSRRVVLTRLVPSGGGTLRIGAGSHAYANAPTGILGLSESSITATVRSLCIAAT